MARLREAGMEFGVYTFVETRRDQRVRAEAARCHQPKAGHGEVMIEGEGEPIPRAS